MVRLTKGWVKETVSPLELLDLDALKALISKESMLLPVKGPLSQMCREVALHLCNSLETLLESNGFQGGYLPSWECYQMELALEEMFYGQPRCPTDLQYSVALGCSSVTATP